MQKFLKIEQTKILLFLIVLVGALMRLYNLNWDEGHYLHPDERLYVNASNITLPHSFEEFLSPDSPLNPHMFYYGSFPLFLYKAIYTIFTPDASFLIVSRAVSAFFSILTIPIIYLIGKVLFSKKVGLLAAFIFTFSVGSIQHAHFNTTEGLLALLLSLITYLSIRVIVNKNYLLFITLAVLVGMAIGTKVTGSTFALIPLLSFIVLLKKERKSFKKHIAFFVIFSLLSILVGFLAAPYQLIAYDQFSKEQSYMQNVILGNDKPVFTIIYEKTIPYFYQFTQIFPFSFGFFAFPTALLGAFLLLKNVAGGKKIHYLPIFILVYPILYFLWSGVWYAKFSRYYLLLFPFFALWSAYALAKFQRFFLFLFICAIAINGLLYLKVYMQPHTRIAGSQWIYNNIPSGETILGEHWDDNLPMPLQSTKPLSQYNLRQLEVYNPDTPDKIEKLTSELAHGEYFVISSRRVYYSISRNEAKYPFTSHFYELLFKGELGYQMIKSFTNYPFFFSDDIADESFQSYDHPPIYIFKNEERLRAVQIERRIFDQ